MNKRSWMKWIRDCGSESWLLNTGAWLRRTSERATKRLAEWYEKCLWYSYRKPLSMDGRIWFIDQIDCLWCYLLTGHLLTQATVGSRRQLILNHRTVCFQWLSFQNAFFRSALSEVPMGWYITLMQRKGYSGGLFVTDQRQSPKETFLGPSHVSLERQSRREEVRK
jgi:hypothetical protein